MLHQIVRFQIQMNPNSPPVRRPPRQHRPFASGDQKCPRWTECSVAVANQVTRRFVPGKGVSHLTCDPLGGRIVRHADADQSPSGVAKNRQEIEQLEALMYFLSGVDRFTRPEITRFAVTVWWSKMD